MEYDYPLFRPPSEARSLVGPDARACEEKVMGGGFELIDKALMATSPGMLRPEWMRGL